jgi:hypothetical protein
LKKRAPGALDRLDAVVSVERGSKVVAEGAYQRNPWGGTNLQLPEIPRKVLEPATGIEPATCGLRISDSPTSDNLTPQETTNQDAPEMGTDGGD